MARQVSYIMENLTRCRCPQCPVHGSSACVMRRVAGRPIPLTQLPPPGEAESVYCSEAVGASACGDLDGTLECLCPTCPVWQKHGLRSRYFCMQGPAG
jgi:hypothetical protein